VFAEGDETQALDTRMFAASHVGEGVTVSDTVVPGMTQVPLDKPSADNRYFLIIILDSVVIWALHCDSFCYPISPMNIMFTGKRYIRYFDIFLLS